MGPVGKKLVENMGEIRFCDARPGIFHPQHCKFPPSAQREADGPPFRGEAEGIIHRVLEYRKAILVCLAVYIPLTTVVVLALLGLRKKQSGGKPPDAPSNGVPENQKQPH